MHINRNKLFLFSFLIYIYSSIAYADITSVKKSLDIYFPNKEIKVLKKIPYLQLYEITIDNQLFYVDEKVIYFFSGHLFNLKTQKNITTERLQEINESRQVNLDSLPLEYAIKEIKGNGKRTIIIFSDPNCGYCKRLEKELAHVNDVTIYTLLYPILEGSKEISKAIWCSDDKLESWRGFMLNGKTPTGKNCSTPIDAVLETGKSYGFNSTPTIIFANGTVVPGMISTEMIEQELDKSIQ